MLFVTWIITSELRYLLDDFIGCKLKLTVMDQYNIKYDRRCAFGTIDCRGCRSMRQFILENWLFLVIYDMRTYLLSGPQNN